MKKFLSLMALACTLALTATAGAATVSGSLDLSDPTWGGTGTGFAGNYDVVEFSVGTNGLYTIDAFYPGDVPTDQNLDGYIRLFENLFDPGLDGSDQIAFDDDGPGGQNTSQILDVALTAGTTYFLVVTSFDNIPTSFGLPNGAWEADIAGAGDVTIGAVPVPAAIWFMMSGLIGLIGLKRRS